MRKNYGLMHSIVTVFAGILLAGAFIIVAVDARHHFIHIWETSKIEGNAFIYCTGCGKVKQLPCSHDWEFEKVGDKIVAVCKDCGEVGR